MEKIILSLFALGLLTAGAIEAQNSGNRHRKKKIETTSVTGSRAGNCVEKHEYYINESNFVSSAEEVMIYVDPDEWAFFHDSSWIQAVNILMADTFDDVSCYDSVYLEIYEGSSVTGLGLGDNMTLGNLIYASNVTTQVANYNPGSTPISNFVLDSLIKINTDTAYTFAIRRTNPDGFSFFTEDGSPRTGKGDWSKSSGNIRRGNSNWMIDICIDGSAIVPVNNISIGTAVSTLNSYEVLNFKQLLAKGMTFSAPVKNNGLAAAINVDMAINIVPENSGETVNLGNIAIGATETANFSTAFVPVQDGFHYAEITASMDSTDSYMSDNERFSEPFYIHQSRYGRAQRSGVVVPTNWSTSFTDIFQGNIMDIYAEDTLKYLEIHLSSPENNSQFYGFCLGWDSSTSSVFGDTLITDTFLVGPSISSDGDTVITLRFQKHTLLDPGKYIAGVVELTGEFGAGIGTNARNFVPNTAYYTLSQGGSNVGSWISAGSYYPVVLNFENTYNTGIANKSTDNSGISVYPNPAKDIVNVKFDKSFTANNVQILDILGHIVLSENTKGMNALRINTSTLSKGVYILKAQGTDKSQMKKFVIE